MVPTSTVLDTGRAKMLVVVVLLSLASHCGLIVDSKNVGVW